MTRLELYRWLAALTLAIVLVSSIASVLEADTLSIGGTFHMDQLTGTVGADLAEVFAHDNEHTWSLTLYGVTHSYFMYKEEWDENWGYGHDYQSSTRVHATSFDFQFFGPDANVLNEVVSQQLIGGGLYDYDGGGIDEYAFLELINFDYFDSTDIFGGGWNSSWLLGLQPLDPAGVSINAGASSFFRPSNPHHLSTDENGYPVVAPRRLSGDIVIYDDRPGTDGELASNDDFVDIEAPILVLPGDYNNNGIVDAADYTVWRDRRGSGMSLPNDDTPGIGPDDYTRWLNNFGQTLNNGSAATGHLAPGDSPGANYAVPEPGTVALLTIAVGGWYAATHQTAYPSRRPRGGSRPSSGRIGRT